MRGIFKRAIAIALFGAVSSPALLSVSAEAAPPKGPCTVSKQVDVPAKMRDGVTLLADVYRPTETGAYPVLLMRLPYNKTTAQTYVYASPEYYASQCYIVAIQDVRGQYASQGVFYAFKNEMEDGYDSVEWAAALPGSNGKVGMYGFSYVGATQWLAAVMRPPHLAAIAPAMTSSDYYDGWSYEGGAWSLAFEESWPIQTIALVSARRTGEQSAVAKINEATGMIAKTYDYLPLHDYPWLSPGLPAVAGYFYDWIAHDTWDDYWRQWSIRKDYGRVQVPALNFDGWYDVFLNGAVENYVGMRKDGGSDAARSAGRLGRGRQSGQQADPDRSPPRRRCRVAERHRSWSGNSGRRSETCGRTVRAAGHQPQPAGLRAGIEPGVRGSDPAWRRTEVERRPSRVGRGAGDSSAGGRRRQACGSNAGCATEGGVTPAAAAIAAAIDKIQHPVSRVRELSRQFSGTNFANRGGWKTWLPCAFGFGIRYDGSRRPRSECQIRRIGRPVRGRAACRCVERRRATPGGLARRA